MSFWQFLQLNWSELFLLVRQHIVLVFIAILIAVIIGVPTGIALTRHRALRFIKSETTHTKKRVALDEALLEKIEALGRPLAEKERDEAMIEALDSLPADYAMPLRLRFLDEMPINRIAAFMGIPLSTVKWRIHHGKKLLRTKVEATN